MSENKAGHDWLEMTEQYHSCLLGASDNVFARDHSEPMFLYSQIRNAPMEGYESRFDLLAMQTEKGIVVSYGDGVRGKIPALEELLKSGVLSLEEAIFQTFEKRPYRSFQYYFSGNVPAVISARPLKASDYDAFEAFFLQSNKDLEDVSWLREYFEEMIAEGSCCGVFVKDLLVSCTDAPAVPFMKDSVREIGINTLEEHRHQGFAKDACSCAIREALKQGKCPVWSTSAGNKPSQRLAESIGFRLFGEMYSI